MVMGSHWLPTFHFFEWGAGIGVTFFFVLSGYLISSNLFYLKRSIDEREISVPFALLQFYFRRTLRIFPLYYFVISILFLLIPQLFAGKVAWYFAYLPNFLIFKTGTWPPVLSPFWSLAVEEQFYLIWPLLIFFVNWRWLKRLFAVIILFSIVSKAIALWSAPSSIFLVLPWNQFDAFGMGAILAYVPFSRHRNFLNKKIPFAALFVGFIALSFTAHAFPGISFLFNLFLSISSILVIQRAKEKFKGVTGWILDLPVLQYLGRISYGLYIYHDLMPMLWNMLTGKETQYPLPIAIFTASWMSTPIVNLVAQFVLLVIISSISWYLFEKPILRLKDALYSRRRPVLET